MADPFAWMAGQLGALPKRRVRKPEPPRSQRFERGVDKVVDFVAEQSGAVTPQDVRRELGYSIEYASELLRKAARFGLVTQLPKRGANDSVRVVKLEDGHDAR